MLWIKSLHIIFMVTWFAGLFYLPRLFVYHAMSDDDSSNQRFKIMERKLFYGIMTPGGVLTILFGLVMLKAYAWETYGGSTWLTVKLILVALLIVYHVYCGKIVKNFRLDRNRKSHIFYRWFNEFPVILLFIIVIMTIIKPL